MRYLNNVQDLTLGSLYELDVTSWQARVPWFDDKNRTDHNCVTPPANGTYVVYLGKYAEHDIPYYRLLSSDGNMYRTYNTNFVHGLKETNKPRRKTTTKKIPRLTSVEEAMEVVSDYLNTERFRADPYAEDVASGYEQGRGESGD
jgi:hypothetical protein